MWYFEGRQHTKNGSLQGNTLMSCTLTSKEKYVSVYGAMAGKQPLNAHHLRK